MRDKVGRPTAALLPATNAHNLPVARTARLPRAIRAGW